LQAFRELCIDRIPAVLVDVTEEEVVGRFLAENMMRRKLSWKEKAHLIEYDTEVVGISLDEVADLYCITLSHAKKYLRILKGASDSVLKRADDGDLDMNATEKLTTIPKDEQNLVIEVLDEQKLDKSAVMHLVEEANRLRKSGRVTKDDLAKSVADLNEKLRNARQILKLRRKEYGLGPQHLFRLAREETFVVRAETARIDLTYFQTRE